MHFNKIRYDKKYMLFMVFLLSAVMLAGCGNSKNKNGSMISDDGRSYGGLIEENMGKTVHTAFFDLTVEDAVKSDTYQFDDGLYQAEQGNTYLLVKVTVKNTYEENISMSITDFVLDYEGKPSKEMITGYGKSEVHNDEFMDNLYTLKKGESMTKTILFTVADKEEYLLKYVEYYADDFEGNTFQIKLKPKISEQTATEAPAPEATPTEAPVPEATPTEAPVPEATPTEAPAAQ